MRWAEFEFHPAGALSQEAPFSFSGVTASTWSAEPSRFITNGF